MLTGSRAKMETKCNSCPIPEKDPVASADKCGIKGLRSNSLILAFDPRLT